MGGSTKTVKDLASTKIFPEKIDLYQRDIQRIVGMMGLKINIPAIVKALNNNQQFMYNEQAFRVFGVSTYSNMEIKEYTDEAILAYIKSNIDNNAQEFVCKTVSTSYYLPAKNFVEQNYSYVQPTPICDTVYFTEDCPNYNISKSIDPFEDTNTNKVYRFRVDQNKLITQEVNGVFQLAVYNCTDSADEWLDAPKDERLVWAVRYKTQDGTEKEVFIYRENVSNIFKQYKVFILPLKKDGSWQGDNRYIKFLLNRYGLGSKGNQDSGLKESLDNSDIKDAFITYAATERNGKFKPYIDAIYGSNNENLITINAFVNIEYNNGNIKINGKSKSLPLKDKDGNHTPSWIIPHELLTHQGYKDKYETYKDLFALFVYMQKTIHLKWYQTWFFKIFFFFVGIVFAFVTGGTSLGLLAIGGVALSFALSSINPKLGILVDLLMAIETFGASLGGSLSNILMSVEKIFEFGARLYQLYIGDQIEDIAKQLANTQKETKKLKEDLLEMKNKLFYVNFLDLQDMQYNLMYNSWDIIYDYDKFFIIGARNEF